MTRYVRAEAEGFYDGALRKQGDEFVLRAGDKMGAWMTPIDAPTKPMKQPTGPTLEIERLKLRVSDLEKELSDAKLSTSAGEHACDDLREQLESTLSSLDVARMQLATVGAALAGQFTECKPEYESRTLTDALSLRKEVDQFRSGAVVGGSVSTAPSVAPADASASNLSPQQKAAATRAANAAAEAAKAKGDKAQ